MVACHQPTASLRSGLGCEPQTTVALRLDAPEHNILLISVPFSWKILPAVAHGKLISKDSCHAPVPRIFRQRPYRPIPTMCSRVRKRQRSAQFMAKTITLHEKTTNPEVQARCYIRSRHGLYGVSRLHDQIAVQQSTASSLSAIGSGKSGSRTPKRCGPSRPRAS